MANLKEKCPICSKTVQVKSEFVMEAIKTRFITYECGHAIKKEISLTRFDEIMKVESLDGHHPFKYQAETVEFVERANFRTIINHEMGLGKMVIGNILLNMHPEELTPHLIVCPASITQQWWQHIVKWDKAVAQILTTEKPWPNFDFFKIFIVSVDTLWRLPWCQIPDHKKIDAEKERAYKKEGKVISHYEALDRLDKPEYREIRKRFKGVTVDEVQKVSNPTAKRTQAIKKVADATPDSARITLSGTPIRNNALEYFPALNFVRPDIFPTEAGYIKRFVRYSPWGKVLGMTNVEKFHDLTKDFIIRFTREEKLPDLPKIFRQFKYVEMQSDSNKQAYQDELEAFLEFMEKRDNLSVSDMTDILGYFARMRHIAALDLVEPTVEHVEQFLLETDRKHVIFTHHQDAAEFLYLRLQKTCEIAGFGNPLRFTSALNSAERLALVEEFKKPENRLMIASTQAAGEGINLQFCSDATIMERQWNPAIEEQAEARFPRPGSTASQVNITYMVLLGTIVEMLTEVVEKKRMVMRQVIDGVDQHWTENSTIKELANVMTQKGRAKWRAAIG